MLNKDGVSEIGNAEKFEMMLYLFILIPSLLFSVIKFSDSSPYKGNPYIFGVFYQFMVEESQRIADKANLKYA